MGCLYLITNLINNKKYVGQHKYDTPTIRWKQHRYANTSSALHSAFRKYGLENFKFEIIRVAPSEHLTALEQYYAEVFGTYIHNSPSGYNMITPGTVPLYKHSRKNTEYMQNLLELYIQQNETELLRKFIDSIKKY
jgi:group I intron endonuclease